MDKLITAIQTTDVNSEKDLKNLRSTLQKAEEVLFKHLPHLDEALSILDPKIHTLGWMYILYVKADLIDGYWTFSLMLETCRAVKSIAGAVDPARYVAQVRALIPVANTTQVRLAPSKCACPPPPLPSMLFALAI